MSLAGRKKKKSRQQRLSKGGSSGGGSARLKLHRGRGSSSDRSASDSRRKSPAGAELKRSKGMRDLLGGRSDSRRERANARADLNPYSPPKISKPPALIRSVASRDLNKVGKRADTARKTRKDLATGRTLFPVDRGGSKIDYLPVKNQATEHEKKLGLFVDNDSVKKAAVNTLRENGKSVTDFNTGRTLFATETADGKLEYLPREKEATGLELSRGKFIPDNSVVAPAVDNKILDKRPLFEFNNQRYLFATESGDGSTVYLPKKSDANAEELKQGQYVNDEVISKKAPLDAVNSMSNKKPLYDIGKGRRVFAIRMKDGSTRYLPRQSDAEGNELKKGLYIPNEIVDRHLRKVRRTALRDDSADHALRRAQRAARLAGGVTAKNIDTQPHPAARAKDGTELWDGASLPDISEKRQRQILQTLKPRYDLGKGRMVYPAETAKGKIEYLPLFDDATDDELFDHRYAAFVPLESLQDFLQRETNQDSIKQQTFDTDQGKVKAYTRQDIEKAFDSAPMLVLRSAKLVTESAKNNPALQQQWL